MILASLIGGTLSVIALCAAVDQIGRSKIRIPSSYRLSGSVSTTGTLAGKSNDILSGSIRGNLSGTGSGTIRGDLSGSLYGSINGRDDRFNGSLDGRTNGDFRGNLDSNIDGQVFGQMQSNTLSQFAGRTEESGTVTGDISPVHSYFDEVTLDKPGRPWLCVAFVLFSAAILTYIRRLYHIIRRRKSVIESTSFVAKLTAAGGLMFFAGSDGRDGLFLLGLCVMAHAGIGYLAYTHWERVRAQLYKD